MVIVVLFDVDVAMMEFLRWWGRSSLWTSLVDFHMPISPITVTSTSLSAKKSISPPTQRHRMS
jgi:hypothetical protein